MGKHENIKVVMVCNFSDAKVREHLPLMDWEIFNHLKFWSGGSSSKKGYGDLADWNRNIADYMCTRDEISFFLISPHPGMKKMRVSFTENNVKYIFFNIHIAGFLKRFIKGEKIWRKINPFARSIKKEIERINPHLVVLMGAENPYYSDSILGIENYPVYVMCQTVYNNPTRKECGIWDPEKEEVEKEIFKTFKYIGVYSGLHYRLVRQLCGSNAYIFKFGYPSKGLLLTPTNIQKKYDFINFAYTIGSHKGFDDSIRALAIVKKQFPDVTLNIVGRCGKEYYEELSKLLTKLGLKENVIFTPFFENKNDLFEHIQKSRFAVLPCKLDYTSGTMSQAMELGLPIVVYKTEGTPYFNRNKQCALIAEMNNVDELAQNMLRLMIEPELAMNLRKNAREYREKKMEQAKLNGDNIVENFNAIIDNYWKGIQIPQEQLFNPDKDD